MCIRDSARTMLNLVEYASSLPEEKRNLPHVKATLPEILSLIHI